MDESRRHKSALCSVYQENILQACARSWAPHRDGAIFLSLALSCQNRGPNHGADLKKPADVARVPNLWINKLLYGLSRLEDKTWGRLSLPFGSSLRVLGTKPLQDT